MSEKKDERSYIKDATRAATHPMRSKILKLLKDSSRSTIELEKMTGESRPNLYHHLYLLEKVDLIKSELKDNKTKIFSLDKPKRPDVAVFIFDEDDIDNNRDLFNDLFDVLSKIEGQNLPHKDKLSKAEICLHFEWSEESNQIHMA